MQEIPLSTKQNADDDQKGERHAGPLVLVDFDWLTR
jgi:hypothetical protein